MKALFFVAGAGIGLGLIILAFDLATWPKSYGILPVGDTTPNVIWLGIAALLLNVGILAGLLALHANALDENARRLHNELAEKAARQAH